MTARTPPMTLNAPSCWNTFKGFMGYLSFFSVIARGDRYPQAENSIPEKPGFVKTGSASSRKQCGRDGKAASRGRCRFALPVKFQSSAKRIPLLFSVHFSLLSGNGNSREEGREKREENKKKRQFSGWNCRFFLAESVRFELTVGLPITSFQDWLLKPLGQLSIGVQYNIFRETCQADGQLWNTKRPAKKRWIFAKKGVDKTGASVYNKPRR